MSEYASELDCAVAALFVHPVKSCAGFQPDAAVVARTGLAFDRGWMVVDGRGEMVTQRELPRMALVQPGLRSADLVLRAPGMLALHLRLDTVEAATRVRVWDDIVKAHDMGALAAQWLGDFLGADAGRELRLVRFDPAETRLSSARWAGTVQAENAFADGFPLLVANAASLEDLNARLAARGQAAITMARFRPNLVLEGLQPYDEDHIDELRIDAEGGPVTLRLVKPCVRCTIPNVDPATADCGLEPGRTLAEYRADPRMQGGITFAMNAVILSGFGRTLRPGQPVRASWRFE